MIEINLVELNNDADYVRYEIIKNESRFITGWIRLKDIQNLNTIFGVKDIMVLVILINPSTKKLELKKVMVLVIFIFLLKDVK